MLISWMVPWEIYTTPSLSTLYLEYDGSFGCIWSLDKEARRDWYKVELGEWLVVLTQVCIYIGGGAVLV